MGVGGNLPSLLFGGVMSFFICPVCNEKLNKDNKAYRCDNNHSFDIAKQGYINLLPVNKRHSDDPGDTKEMVLSRREFLESGKYDCFSVKLNETVARYFGNSQNISILDCGCGEGFYDGHLMDKLEELKINYSLVGFDISKNAVRYSAGKYKKGTFAVASCFNMPVADKSFDLAINIFAPMVEKELNRVLKNGGYFIYAVPGKRHLMGLKEALYENVYENEEKHTEYQGFEFVERISVKDVIEVEGDNLINLFKMTPYYFKTEKEATEKLINIGKLKTEIHFDFLVYKKTSC